MNRFFIVDSHPIQYKAPVFREIARICPDSIVVIYATSISAKGGYKDDGFGEIVKWDMPLLDGYTYEVLNAVSGEPLRRRSSLRGTGLFALFRRNRPEVVILCQSRYLFDFWAYFWAFLFGCNIWIRQETQDEMFVNSRSPLKKLLRYLFYRSYYFPVKKAFCFGELNRRHLMQHGFRENQLVMAHFSTYNPFAAISRQECMAIRQEHRASLGIRDNQKVIGFFGKFIPKKNPEVIFQALELLMTGGLSTSFCLLFVGSGEQRELLERCSLDLERKHGIRTIFPGFVNQSSLPPYYVSTDILVLPSRPMGEAWGLVVNEGLQAGCAIVVSSAVGCAKEFESLERFRVYDEGNVTELSIAIRDLIDYEFDSKWADDTMINYSTEAAANAIAAEILKESGGPK